MKLFLSIIVLLIPALSAVADKEVVCYWGTWSVYRWGVGGYLSTDIDPKLCTTLIYSFLGLNRVLEIDSLDSWADINLGGFANVTALRDANPGLKVLVALGGWNDGSLKYSVAASSADGRERLALSILKFLAYYNFNGIDIDWEYPTSRGGIPDDKTNFPLLLQAIKEKISPWNFTLSIAVPFEVDFISTGYDIASIAPLVNYVHVMAYDYVSPLSPVTGLSSPMSVIERTVTAWIDGGVNASKLVLGVQSYARAFQLKDPTQHDVGAEVEGPAYEGIYTGEAGFLAYYEVLNELDIGMTEVTTDGTNYAYDESGQWLTYENEETIRVKANYVMSQDLGGLMFWAVDLDDFAGLYGNKYPLLTAANQIIRPSAGVKVKKEAVKSRRIQRPFKTRTVYV